MAPTLQAGDRVSIRAGMYKKYKKASCVRPYGLRMATILVDTLMQEKNVWLTLIKKVQSSPPQTTRDGDDVVTIRRADYLLLKEEVASLTKQVQRLSIKVNELME